MVTKLMAGRNCSRGTTRSTVRRPTGISSAPPTPCTTREAISMVRLRDSAHSSDPTVNRKMAAKNMRRVPKRSASQPEAGISMAVVSV
jgi:hypothetical protein